MGWERWDACGFSAGAVLCCKLPCWPLLVSCTVLHPTSCSCSPHHIFTCHFVRSSLALHELRVSLDLISWTQSSPRAIACEGLASATPSIYCNFLRTRDTRPGQRKKRRRKKESSKKRLPRVSKPGSLVKPRPFPCACASYQVHVQFTCTPPQSLRRSLFPTALPRAKRHYQKITEKSTL